MALTELLPDVDAPRDIVVRGLVQDSRAIEPGDAFVAIAGFGAHGLGFVDQARQRGASAILFEPPAPAGMDVPKDAIAVPDLRKRMGGLADRFHAYPSREMNMVAVTGTNGKTSTVQLLAQAWHIRGTRCGSIGTLGAGMYGEVVPTGFTTPLVLQMHALLAQLRDTGAKAVAMEVSSHALDQGRVDGVHFDVAVFTNLTRDHLDYHGDMSSYGATKARLFAWPGLKSAVVNLDDDYGRELFASLPATVRAIGVSSRGQAEATLRADSLRLDASGISFELDSGGESHPVQSRLLGRFNVDNLLAVAGALNALGEAPAEIAHTLSRLQPIHGRMNRLGGESGDGDRNGRPLVVIDYAHPGCAGSGAVQPARTCARPLDLRVRLRRRTRCRQAAADGRQRRTLGRPGDRHRRQSAQRRRRPHRRRHHGRLRRAAKGGGAARPRARHRRRDCRGGQRRHRADCRQRP